MNERIRLLAEQAGIHNDVCSMCPIHELEKFVELIIKECSDALEKRHQEFKGTKSEYANGFKSGISAAKRTLDAHFKDNT
jgi:hypothetical protein